MDYGGIPATRRFVSGFTVLELLVTIAAVGMLVAILLPAMISARESGRRITCSNQLKQIGLAMHQHHDLRGRLPPAWRVADDESGFAYGWAAAILPGLEQPQLLSRIDPTQAPPGIGDASNAEDYALGWLLCPSDLNESTFVLQAGSPHAAGTDGSDPSLAWLPTTNYVGVYGTVEADEYYKKFKQGKTELGDGAVVFDRRVAFADFGRGQSKTLLIGERTMALVPSTWLGVDLQGEDAECRLVGSAMTRPNCRTCDECEFTSRHAGGSYFAWADGRVELVAEDIEPETYRQLARRSAR